MKLAIIRINAGKEEIKVLPAGNNNPRRTWFFPLAKNFVDN